ncbi:hypothetical protein HWV62_22850 [Athelia sp. TMB]|nr:hypothetical protein HWV62_22850 [Athelia sp. TMB]
MYAPLASFIEQLATLSSGDESLKACRDLSHQIENTLRELYARDPTHQLLTDPTVGLIDLFSAQPYLRTIHARRICPSNLGEISDQYILPLSRYARRKDGEPATVTNLRTFLQNWEIFTERTLVSLDWSNVIAAGGSVGACITPLPTEIDGDVEKTRHYLQHGVFANSDVDLFIWGLTVPEAEAKVIAVAKAVRDATPVKTICVRTRHAISIICGLPVAYLPYELNNVLRYSAEHPYRTVQIVLRIYSSPAEVILSFDVDSAGVAFDGEKVLITPRAIVAIKTQINKVDMSRRSPSYEYRLAKYHPRGFEVLVEDLCRHKVNPEVRGLIQLIDV